MIRRKTVRDRSEIPEETRPPFVFCDELEEEIEALGLSENISDMKNNGFTVIPNVATPEFSARLRETCIRLAEENPGSTFGRSAGMLLGRDPIFEEVLLNPNVLAMVEVMCGPGAILSQLVASVRGKGAPELKLHADQNWLPAPFPEHNMLFTMCWVLDEFTEAGGATKIVPGSHVHRRHPSREEIENHDGAIAITCPANSLACWDGSVWHGNYPRSIDGERVVLHITLSRLAMRPVENYDFLGEDWLEGKPEELRIMLGREDFLGKSNSAGADYTKLPQTFYWAKN